MQGCNFKCKWCSNPESIALDNSKAKDYDTKSLIDEIYSARMMFFDGGGVTFTGGEPTLQYEELLTVLKSVKEMGIHTAIETNGSHPKLLDLSKYIDYLIMDIKHTDDIIHKKHTAHSNSQTIKNLEAITKSGRQLHLRIPVINHINTNPDDFINLFSSFEMKNTVIEALVYHEYGKCKWVDKYEINDGFVSEADLEFFTQRLAKADFKLINT